MRYLGAAVEHLPRGTHSSRDAATGANVHTTHVTSWLTLSPDLGALFSQGDIALEPVSCSTCSS